MATANTAVKQVEGFVSLLDFSIINYILVSWMFLKVNTPIAIFHYIGLN